MIRERSSADLALTLQRQSVSRKKSRVMDGTQRWRVCGMVVMADLLIG
jgi:hypothetical protein